MIVVMAAGLSANMTANPFASVTTVTAQIVKLLTGDQEFDSAKTLAAFALGLVLFIVTLLLNIAALRIVKKYREAYEYKHRPQRLERPGNAETPRGPLHPRTPLQTAAGRASGREK